jgi:ABC-type sugar transport system ATPase subunit
MKEIDELISNLDPKYSKIIKSKVKEIIEKYDKLAIELISTYEENESINENLPLNEGSKEKAEKLEELYNNRDIEILQTKLKYVEMSEEKEEIVENEEFNFTVVNQPSRAASIIIDTSSLSIILPETGTKSWPGINFL